MSALETLQNLLNDVEITDICIQSLDAIFIDRGQGMERLPLSTPFSAHELQTWPLEQLSREGATWDARFPFVDLRLCSGHRLHVAFPPISGLVPIISLRRLPDHSPSAPTHWSTQPGFETLRQACQRGESIILFGSTGSGKTTLMTELIQSIAPSERLLLLEDTAEIPARHPQLIRMLSRPMSADGWGEVTLRMLIKQALRMRPDRILLGECRGGEVLDLLLALNTGHRGTLTTLHANSAEEGLKRLELLLLLHAPQTLALSTIRELLAQGIQWLCFLGKDHTGKRCIREILQISGREGDTILLRPVLHSGPSHDSSGFSSSSRWSPLNLAFQGR